MVSLPAGRQGLPPGTLMKKDLFFILFTLLLLPMISFSHTGTFSVSMTKNGFLPAEITLSKGDTVIFKNDDTRDRWPASNIHPTHEIYSEFDPQKPIKPGDNWEFKFDKSGQWKFHDHLYPDFVGIITLADQISPDKLIGANATKLSLLKRLSSKITNFKNFVITSAEKILKRNDNIETKFKEPKKYSLNDLAKALKEGCSKNETCFFQKLKEDITTKHGPAASLEMIDALKQGGLIHSGDDYHQLAHEIGRKTAESFGINNRSFLLCPTSFNYGCGHGFFEYVLGKTDSSKEAAVLICGSLDNDPDYSSKFKFYCYHGLGHGIVMAQAYDLQKSLSICDSLPDSNGQTGCWQGVFMENVNSYLAGKAKEEVFSKDNPLQPCNSVDQKYRWQCYINHSAYLVRFFDNSIKNASSACLKAGENKTPCFQTLGLLTTNPGWQQSLTKGENNDGNIETALQLCGLFPKLGLEDCFIGAMVNIMNYDDLDLSKRAIPFCENAKNWDKAKCYNQIGVNIHRQVVDPNKKTELCQKVDTQYQKSCLTGASAL